MNSSFFASLAPVVYEGPESRNPLAFRWYDKDRKVLGKTMSEHLRFAICYWHSFTWPGNDPFGGETFARPWMHGDDAMALARQKADVAFDMFHLLGVPFYTFHDRDIAPEGSSLEESTRYLKIIAERLARKQEETGVRLLWGTANLFSHRRYMAGAATNPDPDIFAYAAAQVKAAMDVTHALGGENYVLWGGREGYETLLNTNLKREMAQAGRFLSMVVDYKHRIGFKGAILIEPKPKEPTKHQYDYDVQTVYGFLKHFGLEKEVKVNIEQNHAILAGHSFEHELAMAAALGLFGSVDLNRGDTLNGWDTDQFATDVPELTRAMVEIIKAGGFTTGGFNFDAKIRRQSLDPEDLIVAHVGSMDAAAKALLNAAALIEDGRIGRFVEERYAKWDDALGQSILNDEHTLESLALYAAERNLSPHPVSGRQEWLETIANQFC